MERTTNPTLWLLGFLALVALLVGCAVVPGGPLNPLPAPPIVRNSQITPPPAFVPVGAKPAPAVVPGPRFNHELHVVELEIGCEDCHEPDERGRMSQPEFDMCWMCHEDIEEEEPSARIMGVFWDDEQRPLWQQAVREYAETIKWDHRNHAALECSVCHGDVSVPPGGRRAAYLYDMAGCSDCHEARGAPNACVTCHSVYVSTAVAPPSHDATWTRAHGPVSRTQRHLETQHDCTMCHNEPEDCNACHQVQLPSSHLGNWQQRHAQMTLTGGRDTLSRCVYCHSDLSWCDRCHDRVPPTSHRHQWDRRHGRIVRAAGTNGLARCQYCHDDPSYCESCHMDEPPLDHTNQFRFRTHGVMASIDRTRCMTCHKTDFCVRCHEQTAPMSHRAMWSTGRQVHCANCHFPISRANNCRACHFTNPTHSTAPALPPTHNPGLQCRSCHNMLGTGARPLRHIDNGQACQFCHK